MSNNAFSYQCSLIVSCWKYTMIELLVKQAWGRVLLLLRNVTGSTSLHDTSNHIFSLPYFSSVVKIFTAVSSPLIYQLNAHAHDEFRLFQSKVLNWQHVARHHPIVTAKFISLSLSFHIKKHKLTNKTTDPLFYHLASLRRCVILLAVDD